MNYKNSNNFPKKVFYFCSSNTFVFSLLPEVLDYHINTIDYSKSIELIQLLSSLLHCLFLSLTFILFLLFFPLHYELHICEIKLIQLDGLRVSFFDGLSEL